SQHAESRNARTMSPGTAAGGPDAAESAPLNAVQLSNPCSRASACWTSRSAVNQRFASFLRLSRELTRHLLSVRLASAYLRQKEGSYACNEPDGWESA